MKKIVFALLFFVSICLTSCIAEYDTVYIRDRSYPYYYLYSHPYIHHPQPYYKLYHKPYKHHHYINPQPSMPPKPKPQAPKATVRPNHSGGSMSGNHNRRK